MFVIAELAESSAEVMNTKMQEINLMTGAMCPSHIIEGSGKKKGFTN